MENQISKEIIVVVGFGWVGQANALALKKLGHEVYFYDVVTPSLKYEAEYKNIYSTIPALKLVREKDSSHTWYIVCVGDRVSEAGIQDISLIKQALESLQGVQGKVILRSTVLPGSLKALPFDVYMPEFLHEKKAVEECMNPQYFIIGKRSDIPEPHFFKELRDRAVKTFYGTPEESSYIKYLSNLWNSVRIAFVNEFGNTISVPTDEKNLASIERIINFFFENKSYMRYGKAFGGHCLPKDTRAFIAHNKDKGKTMSLLEGVYASNTHQENIEKQYPILPEWYSDWVRPELGGRAALQALINSVKRNIRKRLPF